MNHPTIIKISELESTPDALEATVSYLAEHLKFLKKRDRVLICFPNHRPGDLGTLLEQAVLRREAFPVIWGPDLRWKTLMRLAFSNRITTIIGPPLVILGLTKLARACRTPLFIRNIVTSGYPCLDWMIDGIIKGLDCRTWGIFGFGTRPIVLGFSCGHSRGVHLRSAEYGVEILDPEGNPVPDGQRGEIRFYSRRDPSIKFLQRDTARLEYSLCSCGDPTPRLMDINVGSDLDQDVVKLGQELHSWTSILDCRVRKGDYGLEIEALVFPGEMLPEFPSCAKLDVRPWDPDKDIPFSFFANWKKDTYYKESD